MMHEFDRAYWERHWAPGATAAAARRLPVNPYLPTETESLRVGDALDAGCGTGAEALWLAERGWRVTGADISAAALATATERAEARGQSADVDWVEADLTTWEPGRTWDLVVTHYAHAAIGQLAFYERIAGWVAPGGTLLIVGHLHGQHGGHEHGSEHPDEATATGAGIAELFAGPQWRIDADYEADRIVEAGGRRVPLHDVVVRVHRRP